MTYYTIVHTPGIYHGYLTSTDSRWMRVVMPGQRFDCFNWKGFLSRADSATIMISESASESESGRHLDSCQTPISEVGATISVYPDIGPDIGAVFEDLRYRSSSDIGVPPILGHTSTTQASSTMSSGILTYTLSWYIPVYTELY